MATVNSRLTWVDSQKGWLMILVILGHSIQTILGADCFNDHLWNYIYSFHMPAFMAISGWLSFKSSYGREGLPSLIKRRFLSLMVPYVVWSIVSILLFGEHSFREFINIVIYPDSYYWFLFVLFWINILFSFSVNISKRCNMDILYLICFFNILLIGTMIFTEFRLFGFQFISYYFIFYSIGYCFHRFIIALNLPNCLVFMMFLIWIFLGWFWKMHELPLFIRDVTILPNSLLQYFYRGITALIAIFVLFNIFHRYDGLKYVSKSIVVYIGRYSLGMYVCHLILIKYTFRLIGSINMGLNSSIYELLLFVITIIFSLLIVKFISEFKLLSKYLLGKL